MTDRIDPSFWQLTGMQEALASRDITTVYRLLYEAGVQQREIARRTGQRQSEVSEIIKGRQIQAYDVLVRICEGLEIPHGWMGLAYDEDAGGTEVPGRPPVEEVSEDMKRRALLGVASTALLGSPVLGEILELPRPDTPTPLPSRLGASDVTAIKQLATSLQGVARAYGGCAEVIGNVANRSRALMSVPATDTIKDQMSAALAELHTMAGWCCVDEGLYDQARAFFATAMDLGSGDGYQVAWALRHAGIQMIDAGAYNDGLKAFQLAQISTTDPELIALLHVEMALPLAVMGHRDLALDALKKGHECPQSNCFNTADLYNAAAYQHLYLGQLVTAESYAQQSLSTWNSLGGARRDTVEAEITLATIHLQAGEPDGPTLAARALHDVAPLRSTRARLKFQPLERALRGRRDSTCRDLAEQVHALRGPQSASMA